MPSLCSAARNPPQSPNRWSPTGTGGGAVGSSASLGPMLKLLLCATATFVVAACAARPRASAAAIRSGTDREFGFLVIYVLSRLSGLPWPGFDPCSRQQGINTQTPGE